MRAIELYEYHDYKQESLLSRLNQDNSFDMYKDQIGAQGENWTDWLEDQDPTQNNKYVNWMITRYLKGTIQRLEDIPSKITPALKIYARLAIKKKLNPEHKDINKFKDANQLLDVVDTYKDNTEDLSSKKEKKDEVEQQMYDNGDAQLLFNDSEYKVVIPITHKASCYFGKNTKWCTTTKDDPKFHNQYSKRGPMYIVLHKPTNTRWQFHFETGQYMDEQDSQIKPIPFLMEHKKIFGIFKKLSKVDYVNGSFRLGDKWYNKEGELHREDGPAIDTIGEPGGSKKWFLNGILHREDGPALETADGTKKWHLNGQLHREDGPAVEKADGTKEWYLNGEPHREDGPAIESTDGGKEWFLNGILHREDGPAIEYPDGTKAWYLNGQLHREDGPALEYSDGTKKWYLNGEKVNQSDVMKGKK